MPNEYQGTAVALVSQRKGSIKGMTGVELTTVEADVPLDNMFGFSNELRSATQARTSVGPCDEERRNNNNKHRIYNNLMLV